MNEQEPRNRNRIISDGWSNPDSKAAYEHEWPAEPKTAELYRSGWACLSCDCFFTFNLDWGLGCSKTSRHKET